MNLLQAQFDGDYPFPVPYPTPPQDHSPVHTPIEESGTPWPTVDTERQTPLKFPTPVTDHQREELGFSVADRNPDRYWEELINKLPSYVVKWSRDVGDSKFDNYIKLRMDEAGAPCLGCSRFWAVMCKLHEDAEQQSVQRGSGVIWTAYCLMRENNCEKMCRVMELVLLQFC